MIVELFVCIYCKSDLNLFMGLYIYGFWVYTCQRPLSAEARGHEKLLKTALKLSAPRVRELQLHATTGYLEILGILKHCRSLCSLSLRGFDVNGNQLKTLVSALLQLSNVRIGKSLKTYRSLPGMRKFLEAAKSLKSLIIELPKKVH